MSNGSVRIDGKRHILAISKFAWSHVNVSKYAFEKTFWSLVVLGPEWSKDAVNFLL